MVVGLLIFKVILQKKKKKIIYESKFSSPDLNEDLNTIVRMSDTEVLPAVST